MKTIVSVKSSIRTRFIPLKIKFYPIK